MAREIEVLKLNAEGLTNIHGYKAFTAVEQLSGIA